MAAPAERPWPSRKRASIPRAERMVQAAPTFGVSPSEKRVLDLVTDHPVITREAPCSLAWRLGGTGQPDDAQPRRYLGPGRATRKTRRHPLHLVIRGHTLHYPPRPSPTPDDAGHLENSPHHRPSGPETARGRGRRNTQMGSHGSSRSLRPRLGPTLTASSCGPSHRQVRPRLQLGPVGHRPGRRGTDDRTGPRGAVLTRVRTSRPPPQGSHRPPGTLHELLLIPRA